MNAHPWMSDLADALHGIVQGSVNPAPTGLYGITESAKFTMRQKRTSEATDESAAMAGTTYSLPEKYVRKETVHARTGGNEPLYKTHYHAPVLDENGVETIFSVDFTAIQLNPDKSSRRDASTSDTMIYITLTKSGVVIPGWGKVRGLRKKNSRMTTLW